jgi:hypothetical protein
MIRRSIRNESVLKSAKISFSIQEKTLCGEKSLSAVRGPPSYQIKPSTSFQFPTPRLIMPSSSLLPKQVCRLPRA